MRPLPDLEPAIAAAGRSPDTSSLANLDDRALLALLLGRSLRQTSTPAVDALFDAARSVGAYDELVGALREGRCTAVAIGPVCVQPLEEAGITNAVVPERFRLGAMVKAVCDHASEAASR